MGDKLLIQRGAGGKQKLHIGYAFSPNVVPKVTGGELPYNLDIASPSQQSWVFGEQDQPFDNIQIAIWRGDFTVCQVDFKLSKDGTISDVGGDWKIRNNSALQVELTAGELNIRMPPDMNLDV